MTLLHAPRRSGFTLLEVLLASAIGVMLMGGLYVAMDLVLRQTDTGRQEVEKNDTARAVVNRLTIDCSCIFGPLPPRSGGGANSQATAYSAGTTGSTGTSGTTGATGTTGTTGTTGSTGTSGTTGSTGTSGAKAASGTTTGGAAASSTPAASPVSSSSPSSASPSSASTAGSTSSTVDTTDTPFTMGTNLPFGSGVVGNDKMLSVFVSRVPKGLSEPSADPTILQPTDLRRVTYYLGSSNNGLCRQETPWVTADGIWNAVDADRSNEDADVVADDITDVTFEYFDGTNWQPSWDGSQLNLDLVSILGPPRAIRVTLVIQKTGPGGDLVYQQVRHVLPIRAANGLLPVLPTTSTGGM